MKSSKIMERVKERYRACDSYQDSGRAYKDDTTGHAGRIVFETFFRRPDSFRFSWSGSSWLEDRKHSTILTHDGRSTVYFDASNNETTFPSCVRTAILKDGIYSLHALSDKMNLLTNAFGDFPRNIWAGDFSMICEEERQGSQFYVLESTMSHSLCKAWICESSYLVSRLEIEDRINKRPFDEIAARKAAAKFGPKIFDEMKQKWESFDNTVSMRRIIEFDHIAIDERIEDTLFKQEKSGRSLRLI